MPPEEEGVEIEIGGKKFLVTKEFKEELDKRDKANRENVASLDEARNRRSDPKPDTKLETKSDDDDDIDDLDLVDRRTLQKIEQRLEKKLEEKLTKKTESHARLERFVDKFFDANKQFKRDLHERIVIGEVNRVADIYEKDGESAALNKLSEIMNTLLVLQPSKSEGKKKDEKQEESQPKRAVILEGAPQFSKTDDDSADEGDRAQKSMSDIIRERKANRRKARLGANR